MSSEQAQTVTTAVPDTGFTTASFLPGAIRQLTACWLLGETSTSSPCSETSLRDVPEGLQINFFHQNLDSVSDQVPHLAGVVWSSGSVPVLNDWHLRLLFWLYWFA